MSNQREFHLQLCAGEFVILIARTMLVTADLASLTSRREIYKMEDCGSLHGRPTVAEISWVEVPSSRTTEHRPQCKCWVTRDNGISLGDQVAWWLMERIPY